MHKMTKIDEIKYLSGVINNDLMTSLGNYLNDGFDVFQSNLSFENQSQPDGSITKIPCAIYILVKYEDE